MRRSIRAARVLALAFLAAAGGCKQRSAKVEVDPVTEAQAKTFADAFAAAAFPCDRAKLEPLIDEDALAAKFVGAAKLPVATSELDTIVSQHIGATVVCQAESAAESYKLLRVHMVGGEPRPVFRRVQKDARSGVRAVAYEELSLGASKKDHQVRVVDVYYFQAGQWVSEAMGTFASALLTSSGDDGDEAMTTLHQVQHAHELQAQGKPAEALAILDALPPELRASRATQIFRVTLSDAISQDAYKQALDEVAATFPDDPSISMLEIDGAFLRDDYDTALKYIDQLDRAIGGDPWQDAIRAEAYLRRGKPGDVDLADARARAATTAEPTLAKGWWSRLDVALAKKDWAGATAAMDELHDHFDAPFADENLRASDVYKDLVATPEYAAWRAKHP